MKFIAKTLFGLEKVLADELKVLGASDIRILNRAVGFSGNMEMMYRVNYGARTALAVLMTVAEFRIRSAEDLYKSAIKVEWENYLDARDTFSVIPVVNSRYFNHTGYAGLVLKDAVADRFRIRIGTRPSVDQSDPEILINLHISNDEVSINLDSSMLPLYKRGYRIEQGIAPLNEVLAAGMLLIAGWDASIPLSDPMCGSGTIPIEAGLMACKVPPGRFRKFFGFQRWKDYDESVFEKIKEEMDSCSIQVPVTISGSDISAMAIGQAEKNCASAGLSDSVNFEISDFRDSKSPEEPGLVFLNPPYGERISPGDTDEFYSMIGSTLKHGFPGKSVWLISSNRESLKHIGLKPKEKYFLYNGSLECLFLKYEMYRGTKKAGLINI